MFRYRRYSNNRNSDAENYYSYIPNTTLFFTLVKRFHVASQAT